MPPLVSGGFLTLIILSENKKGKVTFLRRERDSNPRGFRPAVFKTAAIVHSAIPPLTVYHIHSPQWKGPICILDRNTLHYDRPMNYKAKTVR